MHLQPATLSSLDNGFIPFFIHPNPNPESPTNWTPNAMPAHPTPPAIPGSRAEYEACYAEDPDKWYQYLSDAYAWMKEQESNQVAADRKLVELQVQVETQQEEILNLQNTLQAVQIEKSAAMMQRN
ncbi:hypothetical protein FOFC_12113 [Fusarium oxysporum]|nr:hypothetical protein FOFC_12113 [Fusarium oxysporum]